eukprot:UN00625
MKSFEDESKMISVCFMRKRFGEWGMLHGTLEDEIDFLGHTRKYGYLVNFENGGVTFWALLRILHSEEDNDMLVFQVEARLEDEFEHEGSKFQDLWEFCAIY